MNIRLSVNNKPISIPYLEQARPPSEHYNIEFESGILIPVVQSVSG